jgi:hypothetical protein
MPGMTRRPAWLRSILVVGLALGAQRVHGAGLVDFARCIRRAGATYYTAAWCPHCARQNQMFGGALRYLRIVDCTGGCDAVKSFPTWRFADGTRISGVASFEDLSDRTGCRLGDRRRDDEDDAAGTRTSAGSGGTERYEGGAKIIEVPRR